MNFLTTSYLTIDDVPTVQTPSIINFLEQRNIVPIMFCWGTRLEENVEQAVYALHHGAILQNHSWTHPHFSELTFEQAKDEILKTEKLLEKVYEKAGVQRPYKLFRFPYGDQGGAIRDELQNFLAEQGFSAIDDSNFAEEDKFNHRDVLWTFDYQEYNIRPNSGFTGENVKKLVDGFVAKMQARDKGRLEKLSDKVPAENLFLIHDHLETEECCPGYFEAQIKMMENAGVVFVPPKAKA